MQAKFMCNGFELWFSDDDVVELGDFIPSNSGSNPHSVHPWLLHECGSPLAVVFADCLQDALDIAVDAGKLDQFQVSESELSDYHCTGEGDNREYEGISYLGNASEMFDIESVEFVELQNPALSFAALFTHREENRKNPRI